MPADSRMELIQSPSSPTEQQTGGSGQRWRFTGGNAIETLERVAVMVGGVVAMKGGVASFDTLTSAAHVIQGWISANPEAAQIIGAALAFIAREWTRKGHPPCNTQTSSQPTPQLSQALIDAYHASLARSESSPSSEHS